MCHIPFPSHTPWFGEEYKLWRFSLYNFLKPSVISSLLGPNILLNTLFSFSHALGKRPGFTPI
jgi:hypothetical protein